MAAEEINLGDLRNVIGSHMAHSLQMSAQSAQSFLHLTNLMASKSAFEVDASETGLTNANFPRAAGGSQLQ